LCRDRHGGGPFLAAWFQPKAVTTQLDGKIVVGASYKGNMGVFRLNRDGTLDNTFGTSGHVLVPGDPKNGGGTTSVLVMKNGDIVWAGAYDYWDMMVARCNPYGMMITGFGNNGVAKITVNTNELCSINAIGIDSKNRIITAGGHYAEAANKNEMLLCAVKTDGTLDNTFAGNGKFNVSITTLCSAKGVVVQANDQIVAVGMSWEQENHKWVLCRVNKDGTLDKTFGTGGKVTTVWPDDFDAAYGAALDPNGKVVVAGYAGYAFGTARYFLTANQTAAFETDSIAVPGAAITAEGEAVTVYPNPVHSQLAIRGLDPGGRSSIFVKDASGKTVANATVNGQSEYLMDVQQLAPGTYFLQVAGEKKRATLTFLKMP
jgi:uncharacterized delta-60 repeat protein